MDFVQVESYVDYIEANIALGRLQEEGINCWLQDENSATIGPMFTNSIGGIKLMVVDSQAERAMAILTSFSAQKKMKLVCPNCGSDNIELVTAPRTKSNSFWTIFRGLFGNVSPAGDNLYHCSQCGHEFPSVSE